MESIWAVNKECIFLSCKVEYNNNMIIIIYYTAVVSASSENNTIESLV